jgi:hypothetical protein
MTAKRKILRHSRFMAFVQVISTWQWHGKVACFDETRTARKSQTPTLKDVRLLVTRAN